MAYKVRPIYGSSKPGAKPEKFQVIDSSGNVVDTFLYKADAEQDAKRRNRESGKRHMVKI